jgi:hypothetical protein
MNINIIGFGLFATLISAVAAAVFYVLIRLQQKAFDRHIDLLKLKLRDKK